ncbi:MAG: mannose-1-phosphate guanylyltransferase [Candidatus Aminicenantes bacterium]|nr:mannose-1-phosphate guanylyltransferase [Candidatus Aminicenantes bacterium]
MSLPLHAVIMAGGSGTRFWPLSRARRPKQFLPIVGRKTMVEETVERLRPLIRAGRVYTIANADQTRTLRRLLPRVPAGNLLVEPAGRNTAPCLMLAMSRVFLRNPKAVVAALPADHLIRDAARFREKLEAAAEAALAGDHLITFGIPPTFPSTGYGYIHFEKERSIEAGGRVFYRVRAFKEKPPYDEALRFLAAGTFLWNSGIFLWRADVFARKLERHAPELYPFWTRMLKAAAKKSGKDMAAIFREIPAISIDYALMEKAEGVLMTEGDFGWSDVGAWSSLCDVWPRDGAGNAANGGLQALDARDCLVYNPKKLTALIGVKDLVVVDTADALLVCRKDHDQKVKDVVEALKKKGSLKYF